jgi:DNA-binding transcriptional ArsR family regulator
VAKSATLKRTKTTTPSKATNLKIIQGGVSLKETAQIDRVIHERVRLAIISALSVNEKLTFNQLKELLDTTDGNLSVHARKLEEAGYLHCRKFFEGRVPHTEFRLSKTGRDALKRYLDHMEALVAAIRP